MQRAESDLARSREISNDRLAGGVIDGGSDSSESFTSSRRKSKSESSNRSSSLLCSSDDFATNAASINEGTSSTGSLITVGGSEWSIFSCVWTLDVLGAGVGITTCTGGSDNTVRCIFSGSGGSSGVTGSTGSSISEFSICVMVAMTGFSIIIGGFVDFTRGEGC